MFLCSDEMIHCIKKMNKALNGVKGNFATAELGSSDHYDVLVASTCMGKKQAIHLHRSCATNCGGIH